MRCRRLPALVSLAAVALAAAGCSQRSEPVGELQVEYPVSVQGGGDTPVELAAAPRRIVALDAGAAELVDALGAGDRLVAVPAGFVPSGSRTAENVVGATGTIDVDAVVGLDPDLIVATPDTDRVDLTQIDQRTDAPVYLQPSRTLEEIERAVLELGFLLDEPAAARQLVGSIQESVATIEQRLANLEPVTAFVDTGFFVTIPDRSLLGDLLRRARGTNVAAAAVDGGSFPLDELRAADPAVYLTTSDSKVTLASLQRNPETKDLTAVRDGRVVVLPAELVLRAGPNVAKALEALAVALHPDAFR